MTIAAPSNLRRRADPNILRPQWPLTASVGLPAAVFVVALAWTLVVRLPFFRIDCLDDAGFVGVAHLWLRGVLPYVGVFDVKPPGVFALVAAAEMIFGPRLEALRAVAISSDAVTATALFFIARRFGEPRIGVFAAVLYPVLSLVAIGYDAISPLVALTTVGFLAGLSPLPIVRRAVLAGLAMGAAGAVKQTAGFEALALLAVLLGAPDAVGRRGRAALAYVAGLALAPFAFLLYFAWHGAAGALLADVVGMALQRPANASEGVSFADGLMRFLPLQRCLLPLTVFTLLALLRRRAIRTAAPDAPFGALAAWLAAACLGVIAQRSLYMQYFAPAVAPALLIASLCAAKALPELARIPERARLAALAALTLATAFGWTSGDLDRRQDLPALTAAAEAIRASRPAPDDALYVANRGVWLNSMVDLAPPPPKRYYFPYQTLCDFAGGGESAIVAILAAHPRYLVVADRRLKYYCELKENWRPIDAALSRSYRLIAHAAGKFDSYDVYEAAPAVR